MKVYKLLKSCPFLFVIIFTGINEPIFSQKQPVKTYVVEIKKMRFVPEELTINKGDTVVWINRDFLPHDVTELKSKVWSSSILQPGKSWSRVITKNTNYYCSLHVVMKGMLIIK